MTENDHFGVVTDDKSKTLEIGECLHFKTLILDLPKAEKSTFVKNMGGFYGTLLTIVFSDNNGHYIEGSAVLVAPGVAVGATHVFEPRIKDIESGDNATFAIGIALSTLQFWRIQSITFDATSDLAILVLEFASDLPPKNLFYLAGISAVLPRIGENLTIVGFRSSKQPVQENMAEGTVILCNGVVSAHYLNGRDKTMLPFPVLEVSCPSWGGMSGGPVFNSSGLIVGVLATSLDLGEGDGISYVSLIHPALVRKFSGGWPSGFFKQRTSLLGMDRRLCYIYAPEKIKIFDESDEVTDWGLDIGS